MKPLIDAERVKQILTDCLSGDEHSGVPAEGIMHTYMFDKDKLEEHRGDITTMLQNLPLPFRPTAVGGGEGWSFLNACQDANDVQWTGLHWTMEMLFCLGIALDLVAWLLPREMWSALPGGMPYVGVKV